MRFAEKATSVFMSVVLAVGLCPLPALAQTSDSPSNGASLAAAPVSFTVQDGDYAGAGSVASIELFPVTPYTVEEGVDGYEENGVFHYRAPAFQNGDRLMVTDKDGNQRVYTYIIESDAFLGSEMISSGEISVAIEESSVPDELVMKATYGGATCEVPVFIVENPIKRIGYLTAPNNPIRFIQEHEDSGDWMEAADGTPYFLYHVDFRVGDQLRITVDEGYGCYDVYYTYGSDGSEGGYAFISEDGMTLDPNSVEIETGQAANPWGVGKHDVTLRYRGRTCTVEAEVIVNPVSAIKFEPAKAYSIVEETGGSWETDEAGNRYYAYPTPTFAEGDRLIVTAPNGVSSTYTYGYDDVIGAVFASGNAKIEAEDVQLVQEGQWALGANNKLAVHYGGRTCEVGVSITASPIKSISFKPAVGSYRFLVESDDYGEWQDYSNGEGSYFVYSMPSFNEGDALTVTSVNGSSAVYTYQFDDDAEDDVFVARNGNVISSDDVVFNSD